MNHTPVTTTLISLVPLFIAAATVVTMILLIAPRKGKSRVLALLGIIPLVNMVVVVWLLSMTDKNVLDAIAQLQGPKSAAQT